MKLSSGTNETLTLTPIFSLNKLIEQKRWAYVSDYIRAYAIYHYGGIYLDTDVLVLDDPEKNS